MFLQAMAKGTKPARRAEARWGAICTWPAVAAQKLSHRYPLKIERCHGRNMKSPINKQKKKHVSLVERQVFVGKLQVYKFVFMSENIVHRKQRITHGYFYGQSSIVRWDYQRVCNGMGNIWSVSQDELPQGKWESWESCSRSAPRIDLDLNPRWTSTWRVNGFHPKKLATWVSIHSHVRWCPCHSHRACGLQLFGKNYTLQAARLICTLDSHSFMDPAVLATLSTLCPSQHH